MKQGNLLYVALTSITLIALELIWTRLFSAEFFYTFAFLILSLAIMGLGLGALTLRLFPSLGQERHLGLFLAATGLAAIVGPPLVFWVGLDFSLVFASVSMVLKLLLTIVILSSSFFFGGIVLAMFFKAHHTEMPRLYMADMLGAGLGVLLAIIAMNQLGTPSAVFWIALPVLVASLFTAKGWLKIVPMALLVAAIMLGGRADDLLEVKREERAPVVYKHWDAVAKIKIFDFGGMYRGINIDNVANTPVIPFDGNWEEADTTESEWDIDVGYLVAQFDSCTFLSLGSGGGMDVLQALDHGATRIHAVEVIPQINKLMLEGDPDGYVSRDSTVVDSTGRIITCAEYSGHIYRDPRVTVATEDARTYVRRFEDTFDVIFSLSSNTWAALGSGAFALAENYIFTKEAFKDYWVALSEDGFMSMEHQVYMPRLVSEVMDALRELGVEDVTSHFAVYDLPSLRRKLILISKRPLTDEIRQLAYGELTPERYDKIHLLYPAADSLSHNLINQIVTKGWRTVVDSADVNISPCTDDRPFVAQMGMWKNLKRDKLKKISVYAEFRGFPLSGIILAIVLAVVVVLMIPLTLLPYFRRGDKLGPAAWLYFFVIGVAFMAVEIVLIQRYTLFIGASVYSTATVLLTLLIASGTGSRFARSVGTTTAFLAIVTWLLLEVFLFRHLTIAMAGLSLLPRVAITALLVFPLGFFMGMPFPKGALRVRELVDWGFAVNGVASVLGATAVVVTAIAYGFTVALLAAAVCYLFAWILIQLKAAW